MIDLVESDSRLPHTVRQQASRLRPLAERQPDLVLERLDELGMTVAESAAYEAPTEQLAKAVSIESYWGHYVDSEIKGYFPTAESYRAFIAQADDPTSWLTSSRRRGRRFIPALHAWLAPHSAVGALGGDLLARRLALRSRPPFALIVLHENVTAHGVEVRIPVATDAVRGRHLQWRPTGLASGIPEFIDKDVPSEAVLTVEWRP